MKNGSFKSKLYDKSQDLNKKIYKGDRFPMVMTILGWYSLVLLTLGSLLNIASNKEKGGVRAFSVIFSVPVIVYVILNLFK
jgi:uncharacterized membrane protein